MSAEDLLLNGPRIEVRVRPARKIYSQPFRDTFSEPPGPHKPVLAVAGPAIIDTGSSISLIFLRYIRDLRLPKVSDRGLSGIEHDLRLYPFYLVEVELAGVHIDLTEVAGIPDSAESSEHIGYIGRDILQYFHLSYDGPSGLFELTRK